MRMGNGLSNMIRSAIIVCIITLVLFELCGLFIFKNFYNMEHKYSFIGEDNFRLLPAGLWTYEPYKKIREAAIYGFGLGRPWIEYDSTWETNRFGLVKTAEEDDDAVVDLLVLGDSYTQGMGGCPWLTQETLSNIDMSVINGGLKGTGIRQFLLLEQYITQSVMVKNIAVLAIGDDFFRTAGNEWIDSERSCLEGESCSEDNSWWPVKDDQWTHLIPLAEKRIKQRHSLRQAIRPYARWYSLSGYLLDLLLNKAQEILRPPVLPKKPSAGNRPIDSNMAALIELKQKYPQMRLILIPQRDEVGFLGLKNSQTTMVEKRLKKLEINYEWCGLDAGDYLYIDHHPNQKGYEKLFNCLFG